MHQEVVLALLVICHLVPQAFDQILLVFSLEREIPLCTSEFIMRLFLVLVTDLFMRREFIEADTLPKARMDPLVENPGKTLDCDPVSLIDGLNLFIGKATELFLAHLWVGVGHVDELNLAALIRLGISMIVVDRGLSLSGEDRFGRCNREDITLVEGDRAARTRGLLVKVSYDRLLVKLDPGVTSCH